MTRTKDYDLFVKGNDIHKALRKFEKNFPDTEDFTCFDIDCTIEEIKSYLPVTDKFMADGTINNDWTYYFDIDVQEDGFYLWFIERA